MVMSDGLTKGGLVEERKEGTLFKFYFAMM